MQDKLISLESLTVIDAIDRRGSFAKAAEDLNRATSSLSYAIEKLEEKLDIKIFQRQGRRSVLTPAGRLILDEGRKILNSSVLLTDQAKKLADGWEPQLKIALESLMDYSLFFDVLSDFLKDHEKIEIDIRECVLNGGWELLDKDHVDLVVGITGPVPLQRGYKAASINRIDLVPVISAHHPLASSASDDKRLEKTLPNLRRVVQHDTSVINVSQNKGLSIGKQTLYVQTIDQKCAAILAGLGIGHLPLHRAKKYLDSGDLLPLNLKTAPLEAFMVWKSCNKGKVLKKLTELIAARKW